MIKAEYVDSMGTDLTVVNAARVSFDKQSLHLSDGDERLIRYLARNDHWTPFAHCMITLRETVPMFVARQRFKHVVGFVYNEVSRRYVDSEPEFYEPDVWRKRPAASIKQGSSDETVDLVGRRWVNIASERVPAINVIRDFHEEALENYEALLQEGVCPEQARMVLPMSTLTSYYVTGSLAAFARAYRQRSDPHAQREIQDLAAQWYEIIEPLFPVSWRELNGKRISD